VFPLGRTGTATCSVVAFEAWIGAAGSGQSRMFRCLNRHGHLVPENWLMNGEGRPEALASGASRVAVCLDPGHQEGGPETSFEGKVCRATGIHRLLHWDVRAIYPAYDRLHGLGMKTILRTANTPRPPSIRSAGT
jgi:hypothetical protein